MLDKCIMYSEHNSADGELSQTVRQDNQNSHTLTLTFSLTDSNTVNILLYTVIR